MFRKSALNRIQATIDASYLSNASFSGQLTLPLKTAL